MVIHEVRYDWIERIFGTFIADNYNQIYWTLAIIGLIIATFYGRKIKLNWPHKQHKKSNEKWVYNEAARMFVDAKQVDPEMNRLERERVRLKWETYKEIETAKDKARWEVREREIQQERQYQAAVKELNRPIYLTQEEEELSKQIHLERRELTYEEWKAQKLKEKLNNDDHPVS